MPREGPRADLVLSYRALAVASKFRAQAFTTYSPRQRKASPRLEIKNILAGGERQRKGYIQASRERGRERKRLTPVLFVF